MDAQPRTYDRWICPYCGAAALKKLISDHIFCEARICACGAVALAGPVVDTDELVDSAVCLYQLDLLGPGSTIEVNTLDDLLRAGFEYRSGESAHVGSGIWTDHTSLWFRAIPAAKKAAPAHKD